MPDKTPAASLCGAELCERVAEAMGYDRILDWFRPDLDGNHLAEVIAEIERRGWAWAMGRSAARLSYSGITPHNARPTPPMQSLDCSPVVALLRAFVMACEAEKATS